MSSYISSIIDNLTLSDNGSQEHVSTNIVALDFFTNIVRNCSIDIFLMSFCRMWNEDPTTALKVLMNLRDVRGGKGEKFIPRVILFFLKVTMPNIYHNILKQVCVNYGSWKDILHIYEWSVKYGNIYGPPLLNTLEINLFRDQIISDIHSIKDNDTLSLAAKWAPNEKSHFNKKGLYFTRELMNSLHMSPQTYRNTISKLRKEINIVEQLMTNNEWKNIDFSKVPSVAHNNYKNAFKRYNNVKGKTNKDREICADRYDIYLNKLNNGDSTVKINTRGLHPHEIIKGYMRYNSSYNQTTESQWDTLIQNIKNNGIFSKTIAVSDVSGSMDGIPMEVSVAMGILVSECCDVDLFSRKVITFSEMPELFHINGKTLYEKVQQVKNMKWGYNTNIIRVFDIILATAKKFNITPDNMLEKIIIFTDMQFDNACDSEYNTSTTMQIIKKKFENSEYQIPKIIFWNLRTSTSMCVPVMSDCENVALLSGFSTELLKQIMTNGDFSPMTIFNNTIKPYNPIFTFKPDYKLDLNLVSDYITKIKSIVN